MTNRRQLLLSATAFAASSLFDSPLFAQGASTVTFNYRGVTVDTTAAQSAPNLKAVEASLKHQIDIAIDCGAAPKIIAFFKSQQVFIKPGQGDGGGRFSSKVKGVSVDIAVDAPEKPVVLHEMLHAYHWWVLPDGFQNADVERFYERARDGQFYPPDAYVLKNVQEFFAVTASSISGAMSTARRTTARRCRIISRSITSGWAISSGWRRVRDWGVRPNLIPSVVPANAGTHTAESFRETRLVDTLLNNVSLWLWIPGRARAARLPGTTAIIDIAHALSFPRHDLPEFCKVRIPPKTEGAGKAGATVAPAASCAV
ncbi:MAG TPA: hypothetical protein VNY08_17660 [Bradyrhizobium sp.]|nr:hypothetical protein [Bradyrhizobium sp.]